MLLFLSLVPSLIGDTGTLAAVDELDAFRDEALPEDFDALRPDRLSLV
jgi:hypothetical protein